MAKKSDDALAAVLSAALKKYDLSIAGMDDIAMDVNFISTGNIAIDAALGGGIPLGRSVELAGEPSSGKTTTALQTCAELQRIIREGGDESRGIKPDDKVLYLDYEQAMDKEYARALGVDTDAILFAQPDTLEDGANVALDLIATGRIRLVIFDSVAAMNPSAKQEAEIGKSLPAVQAKLMKDFIMNLNSVLYANNATAIFVNHIMEKLDMGGARRPGLPAPTTTPGGKALKYFVSVRVEYKQVRNNKGTYIDPITREKSDVVTSTDVKVKVTKNKVAPPFREAVVRVRFGRGFDNFWTAMQVLAANKYVMIQAGFFYFHKLEDEGIPAPDWMARATQGIQRPYIRGEQTLFTEADKHPEWRAQLIGFAQEVIKENASAIGKVVPTGGDEEELSESESLDAILES